MCQKSLEESQEAPLTVVRGYDPIQGYHAAWPSEQQAKDANNMLWPVCVLFQKCIVENWELSDV